MKTNLKNNSGQHLAKAHVNKITKDATELAQRQSTVHGRELALNKTTTAIYTLYVVDNSIIDINVTQVRKA